MANDRTLASATLIFLVGFGSSVIAEDQPAPAVDEVTQLKKRLDALEKEITTLQSEVQQSGQPGPAAGTNASSSPASSLDARVWKLEADGQTDNGFSFGGVGDVTLSMQKGQGYTATGDFNPIFLYSYKDALLFVAELNADQNGVSLGQAWVAYTALEHV